MKTLQECIDIINADVEGDVKKSYIKFMESLVKEFYNTTNIEDYYEDDFSIYFNDEELIRNQLNFDTKNVGRIRNIISTYNKINQQLSLLTKRNIEYIERQRLKNNKRTKEVKEEIKEEVKEEVEVIKDIKEEIKEETNKSISIQTNNIEKDDKDTQTIQCINNDYLDKLKNLMKYHEEEIKKIKNTIEIMSKINNLH